MTTKIVPLPYRAIDISGQTFGYVTAIGYLGGRPSRWLCQCICGNRTAPLTSNLTRGMANSCGCQKSRLISEGRTTHGMTGTRVYMIHHDMKNRCDNTKYREYHLYGGRGITYDPQWKTFAGFFADMGDCPDGLTLDRIDNSKGYSKDNCRYISHVEQCANRRTTAFITYKNVTKPLAEYAREYGIKIQTLHWRINSGWPINRALNEPVHGVSYHQEPSTAPTGSDDCS